jgi:prepilin-type processing-associated H-X9-DG protein
MRGARIAEFIDGTSNTILVVEAAEAVPWTKPDALEYDPRKPLPALGGHYRRGFHALFADGSVRLMRQDFNAEMLRRMITRDDGLVIDFDN